MDSNTVGLTTSRSMSRSTWRNMSACLNLGLVLALLCLDLFDGNALESFLLQLVREPSKIDAVLPKLFLHGLPKKLKTPLSRPLGGQACNSSCQRRLPKLSWPCLATLVESSGSVHFKAKIRFDVLGQTLCSQLLRRLFLGGLLFLATATVL